MSRGGYKFNAAMGDDWRREMFRIRGETGKHLNTLVGEAVELVWGVPNPCPHSPPPPRRERAKVDRLRIIARDGYKCQTCGSTAALEVDHIDGDPSNSVDANLQTLCRECHGVKTKCDARRERR